MNRRSIARWVVFLAVLPMIGLGADTPSPEAASYAGAAVCLGCHKVNEGTLRGVPWTGTMHARSFLALETGYPAMVPPEAQKMVPVGAGGLIRAEAEKFQTETNCVSCHASAPKEAGSPVLESFHAEDGVQCETCHGPGSLHVRARMSSVGASGQGAGEEVVLEATLEVCDRCHRHKASHELLKREPFDANAAWKRIAHGLPETGLAK